MNILKTFAPVIPGILAGYPLFLAMDNSPTLAQSITVDGTTPTQVTESSGGNEVSITGGTAANHNLFHSFQDFNVNSGQSVTFYTDSTIANILGNVTGGQASIINGQIQLIGSNANLFLINPAGILFGTQASLNLPAAFTATTATGIGFGLSSDGVPLSWWTSKGAVNYQAFVGSPTGFQFTSDANGSDNGSIVNAGQLAVSPGQSLALVGSRVINTGQLTAPGGEILVMAVPGTNLLRVTQPGMILGLEVSAENALGSSGIINPLDLPALLTQGQAALGTQPQLTIAGDGTVRLTQSTFEIPDQAGTTIVSGEISTLREIGGQIAILGDRVALLKGRVEATGTLNGGQINIGGNYQGEGNLPNSSVTFVDQESQLIADSLNQGDGGTIVVWSDDRTAFAGDISARGGANGGNGGLVEVSGKQNLAFTGTVDTTAPQGNSGTLLLDPADIVIAAGSDATGDSDFSTQSGNIPSSFTSGLGEPFTISENAIETLLNSGNVILAATNSITLQDLTDNTLGDLAGVGSFTLTAGGAVAMLDVNDTIAVGGDITISGSTLTLGNLSSSGGNATLTSTVGDVTVGAITVPTGNASITSAGQVQLNGTITSVDDTLEPANLPASGFVNASTSISIITSTTETPTDPTDPTDPTTEEPTTEAVENLVEEDPSAVQALTDTETDTSAGGDTSSAELGDEGGEGGLGLGETEAGGELGDGGDSSASETSDGSDSETSDGSDSEASDGSDSEGGDDSDSEGGDDSDSEGGNDSDSEASDDSDSEGGDDSDSEGGDDSDSEGGDDSESEGGDDSDSEGGDDSESDDGDDSDSEGGDDSDSDDGDDSDSDDGDDSDSDDGDDSDSDDGDDSESDDGDDSESDDGDDSESDDGDDSESDDGDDSESDDGDDSESDDGDEAGDDSDSEGGDDVADASAD